MRREQLILFEIEVVIFVQGFNGQKLSEAASDFALQ